ncbi:immunoglobulin lambda-1 light chain-like [Myripristis murdjan]|uniref:immunoglobulin lambda-1 light chain-like n=1 Tax=Myripristis murdjan TaxID=586833 RepID=UPI0011762837|nr:immunoglobulin lambda-1 light chain-like [Myripristis murdjan]
MLGSLCTLITALTCVSGVTLVTQKPPVVTLTTGQTATMDCNQGTGNSQAVSWYKQVPGGVTQYILRYYHGWSSVYYGSGFSAPKFTSNHQSQSDYRLIINSLEAQDSAVYYCLTWDGSDNEYVFGQGTKLIVTGSTLPPPVLTVFPPSADELQSNKATLVCVASLPSPSLGFADVTWTAAGSPVSSGVSSSSAVQQPDQTFHISSYLAIQTADWKRDKAYTCQVSVGSKASEKSIKKSDCST